ncbi:PLD-like domain containing protein [Nitzschia inconspicua]|uniref:PLD-like domain containing protein n=1 Tax=Nitzschia inconspicua TaxID=303405 RepID=A0A9K3M5Y4_9STRA|nr:PLD-like domain containing protein [Nitzschia inconspicua]
MDWQGKGIGSSDDPHGFVPYDIDYERREGQNYRPLPPARMQKQDTTMMQEQPLPVMLFVDFQGNNGKEYPFPQHYEPYDYNLEMKCGQELAPICTGHFYDRDWMKAGTRLVDVGAERPLLLFTQKAENAPGTKCYMAHENHPFVAMVHLLQEAEVGSTVYMSMPYMTDKHVMDELCHFAQPEVNGGRDLKINIILCETKDNRDFINTFIGGRNDILDACQRLNIHSTPMKPGFCHSKAIVSTAGAMLGSYNYTFAARFFNYEHGILLGPGDSSRTVQDRLKARFEASSPVVYRRDR